MFNVEICFVSSNVLHTVHKVLRTGKGKHQISDLYNLLKTPSTVRDICNEPYVRYMEVEK